MDTTETSTTKPARKPRAVKKPAAAHKPGLAKEPDHRKAEVLAENAEPTTQETPPAVEKKHATDPGRYIFATGRRKTAVANVRLFSGKGDSIVNKKPLEKYFSYSFYKEEIDKPFHLTGLGSDYYFTCHVSGGGPHSQAEAVRHGIATALGSISTDIRKVLKKNGLLTRDDRRKERKKPGLKRARRSPQWAKR